MSLWLQTRLPPFSAKRRVRSLPQFSTSGVGISIPSVSSAALCDQGVPRRPQPHERQGPPGPQLRPGTGWGYPATPMMRRYNMQPLIMFLAIHLGIGSSITSTPAPFLPKSTILAPFSGGQELHGLFGASTLLLGSTALQWSLLHTPQAPGHGSLALRGSGAVTLVLGAVIFTRAAYLKGRSDALRHPRPADAERRWLAIGAVIVLATGLGFLGSRVALYDMEMRCLRSHCAVSPGTVDTWSRVGTVILLGAGSSLFAYGIGRWRQAREFQKRRSPHAYRVSVKQG